jgi:trk system potassium uptake protein TrkA
LAERKSPRRTKRRIQPAEPGDQVVVIGLGRFGGAVAEELMRLGFEVLGIDASADNIQRYAEALTHVVQADATNDEALAQLSVGDFRHAVVGIGSDIEASVLATAALVDLGIPNIWAKAVTKAHGRILERVGAHHVVFPEHDMGHRVSHLVGGRIIDWFQLDEDFAMVETLVPAPLVGATLGEAGVRSKYSVTVVCIKPTGQGFTYATPDTVLEKGAVVVVAGPSDKAESFARLE